MIQATELEPTQGVHYVLFWEKNGKRIAESPPFRVDDVPQGERFTTIPDDDERWPPEPEGGATRGVEARRTYKTAGGRFVTLANAPAGSVWTDDEGLRHIILPDGEGILDIEGTVQGTKWRVEGHTLTDTPPAIDEHDHS